MSKINKNDIYDKNLSFLIGAGASVGILPTLQVRLKNVDTGAPHTFETLATKFADHKVILASLFSNYVEKVVRPAALFSPLNIKDNGSVEAKVLYNYERLLKSILSLIRRNNSSRRANIFTTNYDGVVGHAAERLIATEGANFILNDGGSGFVKRYLHTSNFNRSVSADGVFERKSYVIPQINLVQMHGSIYWYREEDLIEISYENSRLASRLKRVPVLDHSGFDGLDDADLSARPEWKGVSDSAVAKFWAAYGDLPIVNPTKRKFAETVFDEYYYQTLRMLSYELERPNSVFISFGFSFADEHILSVVKRSLSNPTLILFVCCYSEDERSRLERKFSEFRNVRLISLDKGLDFDAFHEEVLVVDND